jgi:TolB protein
MRFRFTIFMFALAMLGATAASAQVRVVGRSDGKMGIDWSGFSAGVGRESEVFVQTLRSDLLRSGWFSSSAAGQGAYRIVGSSALKGGRLVVDCRVYPQGGNSAALSKRYADTAANARRLAHKVADEIVLALTNHRGIASTRFVLIGTASGKKEVYLCDYDGGNLRQLTRDGSVSVAPNWGPDGRKIYYTSYLQNFPDVLEIDLNSGSRRVVSRKAGLNTGAAVSPDGRTLALILSKDGNPELYTMDLRSSRLTRLTQTKRGAEASPCWSPDGRSIAYVSDTTGRPQIYVISSSGGAPRRLSLRGSESVAPDWVPNGWIACASRFGGRYHIFIVNPQSGELQQISSGSADYEDPSWAPNGRHIVCSKTQQYSSQICILDIMGDPEVSLALGRGDWYSPAWSPAD